MFIIDLKASLQIYFKARFRHLKSVTICSSCQLKGVFTSSTEYDPQITIAESRAAGCKSSTENLGAGFLRLQPILQLRDHQILVF